MGCNSKRRLRRLPESEKLEKATGSRAAVATARPQGAPGWKEDSPQGTPSPFPAASGPGASYRREETGREGVGEPREG